MVVKQLDGCTEAYKHEAAILLLIRSRTSFYVLLFFFPLVEKGDLGQEVQRAAAGCTVIFGAGRKCSEWAQHKGATSSGVAGTVCWHSAGMLGVKSVVSFFISFDS